MRRVLMIGLGAPRSNSTERRFTKNIVARGLLLFNHKQISEKQINSVPKAETKREKNPPFNAFSVLAEISVSLHFGGRPLLSPPPPFLLLLSFDDLRGKETRRNWSEVS